MHKCGVNIYQQKALLTTGGWISVICLGIVFILYYYLKIPNLRRHPTNIAIRKCWFELLFVSQYLWLSFASENFFWESYTDDLIHPDTACVTRKAIWPLCFLTQFSLLGGELWFWVLSIDIHVALTNPFSSHTYYERYYIALVFGIAITTAIILVSVRPIQYGLSSDPMVWVKDKEGKTNFTKVGMFYAFIPFIYIYCGAVALWASWQISRGLEDTLKMRKYSVRKQTTYIIGYFMFWTCVYTFQFIVFLNEDYYDSSELTQDAEYTFQSISAFLLASRSLWTLGIFLVANYPEIRAYFFKEFIKSADETNVEDQVQLNIALQKEIVRFTALGIQRSVAEADVLQSLQNQSSSSRRISFNFFGPKLPGDAISFMVHGSESSLASSQYLSSANTTPRPSRETESLENPLIEGNVTIPLRRSDIARASNASHVSDPEQARQSEIDQRGSSNNLRSSILQPRTSAVPRSSNMAQTINFSIKDDLLDKPSSQERSDNSIHWNILKSALFTSTKSSFIFTDYSPALFASIRQLSGVSTQSYLQSFNSTTMPSFSEGRSGAFLYFSSDSKFIVKTLTEREFEKLLQMLPDLEKYIAQEYKCGRDSLLTRYLGAHRIVMYDIPLYFVVMKNVCPVVDEKYDLKGSWVNRHGSKKAKDPAKSRPKKNYEMLENVLPERQSIELKESVPLFLDNDLKNVFLVHPKDVLRIAKQAARDTAFLEQYNLMDYSLLVGVVHRTFMVSNSGLSTPVKVSDSAPLPSVSIDGSSFNSQSNRFVSQAISATKSFSLDNQTISAAAVEGAGCFYFGIIDTLQEWNWFKWYERMLKIYFLGKDGAGLSAVEPYSYRERFMQRAILDIFPDLNEGLRLTESDNRLSMQHSTIKDLEALSEKLEGA